MGRKLKWIAVAALLLVFAGSGGAVLVAQQRYAKSQQVYAKAAEEFTTQGKQADSAKTGSGGQSQTDGEGPLTPFTVDFEKLQGINPQVVGWIYCEGTKINYPVVQGDDNEYYLHYSYEKLEDNCGAIFADAQTAPDFADSNTVLYGHNMNDGSMFAGLELWREQSYYEEHPVMWLLTSTTDYRVVLFSGHTVSAYGDVYSIFRAPMPEFTQYLEENLALSDFDARVGEMDPNGRYVVLSTCAYDFEEARYVVHGKLEPVGPHGRGW